jgi:hypothetical protein
MHIPRMHMGIIMRPDAKIVMIASPFAFVVGHGNTRPGICQPAKHTAFSFFTLPGFYKELLFHFTGRT